MKSEILTSEEVQIVHNLRANPFFRKMLVKLVTACEQSSGVASSSDDQIEPSTNISKDN